MSDEEVLKVLSTFDMAEHALEFSSNSKPILEIKTNGDILVHGRLAANDMEVVDALREWLRDTGYLI